MECSGEAASVRPKFLEHQAEALVTEVGAAIGFGDDYAAPAHGGHVAPGGGVVAGDPAAAVAQAPQCRDRRTVSRPTFRRVAQNGLFFGQHSHVRAPYW
ncbi:MAG: hypothetical protein WDN04_24740 [Rhodospirillales bacterium]